MRDALIKVKLAETKQQSMEIIREHLELRINNLIKETMKEGEINYHTLSLILDTMMEYRDFENITKLKEYMIKDKECEEDTYWTISFFNTTSKFILSSYPPSKRDIVKHVFETFNWEKSDFEDENGKFDFKELQLYKSSNDETKQYIQDYVSRLDWVLFIFWVR